MLELYNNNELDEVYIIYTKMENSFSMEAEMMKLLPRSEERREGKSVDLGGRRIIKKKTRETHQVAYTSIPRYSECPRNAQ